MNRRRSLGIRFTHDKTDKENAGRQICDANNANWSDAMPKASALQPSNDEIRKKIMKLDQAWQLRMATEQGR